MTARYLLVLALLGVAACGEPPARTERASVASAVPPSEGAGDEGAPDTAVAPPPPEGSDTAPPSRAIPLGVDVRVPPDEPRLVLGTGVEVLVGSPVRSGDATHTVHVVMRAGGEVVDRTIDCDSPFSFHEVTITVESGGSRMNDQRVGYVVQAPAGGAGGDEECMSDADCVLAENTCCGAVACAAEAFHVDVLAAIRERCARRHCAPRPRRPCPDLVPPTRVACVSRVCTAS